GHRGIGAGKDGGVGDLDGSGDGEGESGIAGHGVTTPICVVCPLPIYTDEARHVKIQGTVTLRVLVSADGKASQIRVVRGVGYGLEERAVETVRGWKFSPARDASRHNVPAWVTIEAVFRLFYLALLRRSETESTPYCRFCPTSPAFCLRESSIC